jgi:hypothetical protein
MNDSEERKASIIKLVQDAANDADRERAPGAPISVKAAGNVIYVNTGGDAQVAGRDININTRRVVRTTVAAPPGSLSPAQAKRLKDAIDKLVTIEATGGVLEGDRPRLYAKWHTILKDRFVVASYKEIPAARAGEALAWLKQVAAMNRPKLRRVDPAAWRNEHYKAIWARSRQLGLSKGDVYAIVLTHLEKQVISLKSLSDASVRKLYQHIMAMR